MKPCCEKCKNLPRWVGQKSCGHTSCECHSPKGETPLYKCKINTDSAMAGGCNHASCAPTQPESKGWDKIIELVDKQRNEMYELGKKHGKLLVLAEIQEKLPQPEKAHTYASENADIYRHQDEGQEMYRKQVLDLLTGMRKN